MSNSLTFVSPHCWTNNVRQFDPSLTVFCWVFQSPFLKKQSHLHCGRELKRVKTISYWKISFGPNQTFASHVIKFVKIAPKSHSGSRVQVNLSWALYRTTQTSVHVSSPGLRRRDFKYVFNARQGFDTLIIVYTDSISEDQQKSVGLSDELWTGRITGVWSFQSLYCESISFKNRTFTEKFLKQELWRQWQSLY